MASTSRSAVIGGKGKAMHAGSQHVASFTISEDDLYTLRKEASSPIETRKPVVSMQRDAEAGRRRADAMKAHDMAVLKRKAESGALEGEQVEAIARKLEAQIKETATAQKLLAEERKGHVVLTLREQEEYKRRREAAEREREQEFFEAIIRDQVAGVAKDEARRQEAMKKKEEVRASVAQQLEDAAFRRLLDLEAKEQEGALMLAAAQRAQAAADKQLIARKEAAKVKSREFAEANRVFAERDELRKQREAEADELIRQYALEKLARETEAERRRKADEDDKKKRQAAMIAEQKKASDGRAADDEAKARAHEERQILADRARLAAEVARKERDKKETFASLDNQLAMKKARAAEQAAQEEDLRQWQLQQAAGDIQREAEKFAEKKRSDHAAKHALVAQKEARLLAKRDELKRPLLERQAQAQVEAAEALAVERYRASVKTRMERDSLPGVFVAKVASMKHRVL